MTIRSNMYTLQQYRGRGTRHTCPACKRPKCFVYYVNEDGKALSPIVGRCDHQSKCGYHYKPKEFFRDHPDLTVPDEWNRPMVREERKLWTVPGSEVGRFRSNESTLGTFLLRWRGTQFMAAAQLYELGALANGSTIFWQIDKDGKVRTGKVMAYGEDGHRIKTEDHDRVTWMHRLLMKDGILPQDFELTQCLFGEHLLRLFPDKPVALVESEKTAVIMSTVNSEYIWLATGGKNNFVGERLAPLIGRKILLYPDADAVQDWQAKAEAIGSLYDITVCNPFNEDDIVNKRDIADLILKDRYGIRRD